LGTVANTTLHRFAVSGLFIASLTTLGAWFVVKPVRALLPNSMGMVCPNAQICVESETQTAEAQALYAEALAFVSNRVGKLESTPKVVFCHTDACADAFGLGKRSAVTVGSWVTIIGPRAWKPYYVRHELIHVLQSQQLGELPLLFKPQWFKEGMAYGLSEDPRHPLPEPFESDRAQFDAWVRTVPADQFWARAAKL
jgi:hypothetical protein